MDSFQGKYRRNDAENIGSVCLMVREKIGLQTDRHGDNISVFFPMRKKALKIDCLLLVASVNIIPNRDQHEGQAIISFASQLFTFFQFSLFFISRPTMSLGSHQNIGFHTGARANVVLFTYLLL